MSKKVVVVLAIIALVLALVVAGAVGFLWYRNTHVFVEGKAYSNREDTLDLREEAMSIEHYDQLHALLPDCEILWNVPFQSGTVSSDSAEISVATLSDEDIEVLAAYFPNLKKVDASGCGDYAMLEKLQERLPDVEVNYTVSLGGKSFAPDSVELALEPGDYDLDTLNENLQYLPQLTAVTFLRTELTLEQIEQLRTDFPGITFHVTVSLLGQEYGEDTTELDLSAMASEQVTEAAGKLPMLPALEKIILTDAEGNSQLPKEDVKTLQEAVPNVVIDYSFDFFGTKLPTAEEEVHIKNVKIGDEGESEVRAALELLPDCKRFVLENCQISNEVMAKLRDDYRDRTKVVWRVSFGQGTTMTDAEVVRAVYDLFDSNCANLVYCEDVRYADFGHNEYLDDWSFLAGMKSLEVLIVSGSPIKDLSPLESCKKLRVLELSSCGYVTDLTPLAGCESLEMLNISFTKATTGLPALENQNLTHLVAVGGVWTKTSQEDKETFQEQHPDCQLTTSGNEYGVGWRYVDKETKMEWYKDAAAAFRYPDPPNHVGWYLNK